MNPRSYLTGILLSGGQSRRMGRDKATMPFGHNTMLEFIVQQLATVCGGGISIVAAAQGPAPTIADAVTLRDRQPGHGPLEGIAVALQATPSNRLAAIVGCDNPFVSPPLIAAMADRLSSGEADAVVIRDAQRMYPLMAVYRPRVYSAAIAAMDEGVWSLHEWLHRLKVDFVGEEFVRQFDPDLRSLINLNTPQEYQAALKLAGFVP